MALIPKFNALEHSPAQSTGQLPIGRHKVVIESSDLKETTSKDGEYLQLNLRIIEGPNAGDTGPYRLNIKNRNETTVNIAYRQLSAICHVTGVFELVDSSQLHGIPFVVEVGVQKKDPQYTEIKRVFDIYENEPGANKNAAPSYQSKPQSQSNSNTQPQAVTQPQAAAAATEISENTSKAPWNN